MTHKRTVTAVVWPRRTTATGRELAIEEFPDAEHARIWHRMLRRRGYDARLLRITRIAATTALLALCLVAPIPTYGDWLQEQQQSHALQEIERHLRPPFGQRWHPPPGDFGTNFAERSLQRRLLEAEIGRLRAETTCRTDDRTLPSDTLTSDGGLVPQRARCTTCCDGRGHCATECAPLP